METFDGVEIRPECLQPAKHWEEPNGPEIQEVIRRSGMSGRAAADYLGLADKSGRQLRRWISGDAGIPYSAWALLCDAAGFGSIWRANRDT
ncbi:helix-turn-helix domain-containing protein [Paraburkholderia megapolitana]|uniref:XRE family transcriptional regulator n=1 Tax=Paraburkholderia megapolitana TaxID=420953 RepID=UPI0038BB97CD